VKYKWIELPEGYMDISKVIFFDIKDMDDCLALRACVGTHRDSFDNLICDFIWIKRFDPNHKYMFTKTKDIEENAYYTARGALNEMIQEIFTDNSMDGIFHQEDFLICDLTESQKS
jgi:hypothetical protein